MQASLTLYEFSRLSACKFAPPGSLSGLGQNTRSVKPSVETCMRVGMRGAS